MFGEVSGALEAAGGYAEPLGFTVLGLFLLGVLLEYYNRRYARLVLGAGWVVFALFWLVLIYPWFAIDQSVIRGVGAVLAAPLSLLVARSLYTGRDSLFTLSRAVTVMGLVYAPFVTVRALRRWLILTVTGQTEWVMNLLGYDPALMVDTPDGRLLGPDGIKEFPFENTFVFFQDGGGTVTYTIVIACTGIGSMAVMIGLIAAVRAPLRRKLRGLAIAVPIIYVLNIVRNVFIGLSFGNQSMHLFPDATMWLFGEDNPLRVSYIWADRIVAQSMSVVAMILILWLVLREVPEVLGPVEDVLYLLTGTEYDLADALNVDIDSSTPEPAD